jgi:hypothetical protein
MQNQMREEMQKMVGDGSITESFRKQLELSD